MFFILDSDNEPLPNKAPMKRWFKWLVAGVLAAVIILFDIFTGWIKFPPAESYGNTSGNIANAGLAAESDGWIYYSDLFHLYKTRPDGSEKTVLSDEQCNFINIYDGWIYFNNNDSQSLYKICTDGTSLTKLADSYSWVSLENGWLYYISNNNGFNGYICKMKTDGTEKTQVNKNLTAWFAVADGWIYYSNISDGSSLYKIRVDGTDEKKLNSMDTGNINIQGDYVYYTITENYDFYLYKIRTDGTGETKLSDDPVMAVNVSNGWVYYTYYDDSHNLRLNKMSTEGTENVKVSGNGGLLINVAGDWIYYVNSGLYRMKTDGTGNQRVE